MTGRSQVVLALACSLGALVAPALAQSAKALQRELRTAIRELDEGAETGRRAIAAIEALAAVDSKAAAKALLQAANDVYKRTPPILENRRRALYGQGGSRALKRSRYELRYLTDAAEAIARALEGMKSTAAVQLIVRRLTDRGSTLPLWMRVRLAARAAELPAGEFDWRPRAKGRDEGTLVAVIAAVGALGPRVGSGKAAPWLAEQLEHGNEDVRVAAAVALARLEWPGAIELLLGRLAAESGVVREALLDALVTITGQWPGDSESSWRAWLAAEGAPYLRGEVKLGRGDPAVRRVERKSNTSSGSYFGIAQSGASLLYVIDNSLSMKAKLGKGKAKQTRWQVCKAELRSALRDLSETQRFNLVSFANKARCFEREMLPATKPNVDRALEWGEGLKLEFQTNVFDALELSFALAGRGIEDRYYDPDVDTMFFLSDGAPTIPHLDKGGIRQDDSDRILAAVRRWNALRRVTIHAVGIGLQKRQQERDKKGRLFAPIFLRKLAEQNGGRYVQKR
ncbi:MAG: HEAT repeat domain-containing protein [bacterium]|nr:HEAT repeat domain-containing protein [bacterium]